MATIQEVSNAPWRRSLLPATFGGVGFHVEQQARSGGRRVVLHEYPKRDKPYAESMGRHATRFQITGYLIGPDYITAKRALMNKLDTSDGDTLNDPYYGPLMCICERYSVTETRERGGYCTFDMVFVEVGIPGNQPQTDAKGDSDTKATTASKDAATNLNAFPNVVAPTGAAGIGHA